ncbi:hypothetical protein L226DRAFT_613907 [Lentinus tigrinus ALCF2SS1-7]|uniref:uncharacterized protein n=1 Tax=Lentinus tigrinus ALCF2SS1-7 TaxID=1328758 RepID=UPI001165D32F|nr:hypothetical protein L226DRAFT_613907 [Lentinus tigrinus ALCF2SS1-7]
MVDLQTSPRHSSGKRKHVEGTQPPDATRSGSSKRSRRTPAIQPETNLQVVETSPSPSSSRSPSPFLEEPTSSESHGKRGLHTQRQRETVRRAVEKKRHTARWKTWCEEHRWERDHDPGYKQKVGSKEVHRADAMAYFRLKDYEIDTLPYVTFDNEHNPMVPGKSYNLGNLHTLVSRKFAFLHGLDEKLDPRAREVELLKRGWELFDADTKKLEERMHAKGKKRKELVFGVIFIPRQPGQNERGGKTKPRPFGSWTTRVYEDGVYIGEWLNFQFDPDDDDFGDHYRRYERFRPKDAEWHWELDGVNTWY